MNKEKKNPTLSLSIIAILTLSIYMIVSLSVFKIPVVVALLFSWVLLTLFAMSLGYKISEIEEFIYDMAKSGVGLFALLLSIGCMVSIWLSAGTIPTIISWGLKLITPRFFLLVAFVLSMAIALPTGTNWGTVSTVGIAMMGVGLGMGIPAPYIAGTVVSGSCVGDILSPVSDTALLTSSVCKVPLTTHLKNAWKFTTPAIILAGVMYLIFGFQYADRAIDGATTIMILESLDKSFNIGIITLIPLIVVLVLLFKKQSALTSILVGCLAGAIIAIAYQGYSISEVGKFLNTGFAIETGNKMLDPILNRGGIASMLDLIGTVVAALGMGGILKGVGILNTLVKSLSRVIKDRKGLIGTMLIGTSLANALVATNYFSMIMNGTLMTPLYKNFKYKPENTSRVVNNLTDPISMMIPWSMNGAFIATTLGVPIVDMIPYMFFNIVIIIFEIVSGVTGIGLTKYTDEEFEQIQQLEEIKVNQ